MASERILHREQFQNANQMIEVLIRTKPKPPHSSSTLPKPKAFKRDCLLQKELEKISNGRKPHKQDVIKTGREASAKEQSKDVINKNSHMTVEVSKRDGISKKKSSDRNSFDPTWRDLLQNYSRHSADDSTSSVAAHNFSQNTVDKRPSKGLSHKSPHKDRTIQTSTKQGDRKHSPPAGPSNISPLRHHRQRQTSATRHHPNEQAAPLIEANQHCQEQYPGLNGGGMHLLERNSNSINTPAANLVRSGGRISSDGLSNTPFSDSALQLLQQLKTKLQHRGDSETIQDLERLEQQLAGAGGTVKVPTPQSAQSSNFTSVFETPLAPSSESHQAQHLSQVNQVQQAMAEKDATIEELRIHNARLLAQYDKENAHVGKNLPPGGIIPTALASSTTPAGFVNAASVTTPNTAAPAISTSVPPPLRPNHGIHAAALSPLLEVSAESSSGIRYPIYPSARNEVLTANGHKNSRIESVFPPKVGSKQPLSRNYFDRVGIEAVDSGRAVPPASAGGNFPSHASRHNADEIVNEGPAISSGARQRVMTSEPRGGVLATNPVTNETMLQQLRDEIRSLRRDFQQLQRQTEKSTGPPLGAAVETTLIAQQPLASTAKSDAASVDPARSTAAALQGRPFRTAGNPPAPELSSVHNIRSDAGLRVTSTMPTLPSALSGQGGSTNVNVDMFRSSNVQPINSADHALMDATTLRERPKDASQGDKPASQIDNPLNQGNNASSQGNNASSQGNNPSSQVNNPSSQENNRSSQGNNPSSQGNNPSSQGNNPSSQGNKPSSQVNNASRQGNNPSSQGNKTSSQGNNPSSQGNNPSSQGNNPLNQGNNASSQGNNPSSQGNNPLSQGNNASSQGNNASSQGNNPSSLGNKPASQVDKPASQDKSAGARRDAFRQSGASGESLESKFSVLRSDYSHYLGTKSGKPLQPIDQFPDHSRTVSELEDSPASVSEVSENEPMGQDNRAPSKPSLRKPKCTIVDDGTTTKGQRRTVTPDFSISSSTIGSCSLVNNSGRARQPVDRLESTRVQTADTSDALLSSRSHNGVETLASALAKGNKQDV
ncbi:uncharacterized protein LOC108666459 isoform X2 [Hyalella azteca]|uniref:Uncharacterized protein LOC108666459 isoform X2 n=1 Tax=Hyalella azteca TaxID=294128 RepID=A0A8B7N6C3_HYAAZ|nr:uncharacterized protein LOC108666459 isoform X2 [Hyalella azteca]